MEKTSEKEILTAIKSLVESGGVREAANLLGHAYFLEGIVVEGNRIGRNLGYPTANLKPEPAQVIPAQGVYVALVKVLGHWYESMVNIGIRPTLDLENVTIEAHLFDFSEDIYGEKISLHFLERIRDEMRFPSLGSLKDQLEKDKAMTFRVLKEMSIQPDALEEFVLIKRKNAEN